MIPPLASRTAATGLSSVQHVEQDMSRKQWMVGSGVIVLAISVVIIVVVNSRQPSVPLSTVSSEKPGVESFLLASAEYIEPFDEEEVPNLIGMFREACARSISRLSGVAVLTESRSQGFIEAAAERLTMYLLPSYDRYRESAMRITGRDPDGLEVVNIKASREQFERQTGGLRLLPFDPHSVHVRALYIRGANLHLNVTADCSYTCDLGLFFTEVGHGPEKSGATIYEVLVPVDAPDEFRPGKRIRLVLGMAFALDKEVWKPWRMGFHDPSGEDRRLVPPWL